MDNLTLDKDLESELITESTQDFEPVLNPDLNKETNENHTKSDVVIGSPVTETVKSVNLTLSQNSVYLDDSVLQTNDSVLQTDDSVLQTDDEINNNYGINKRTQSTHKTQNIQSNTGLSLDKNIKDNINNQIIMTNSASVEQNYLIKWIPQQFFAIKSKCGFFE